MPNNRVQLILNLVLENMNDFKETIISIDSGKFNLNELVSILEPIESKVEINTISGMARAEEKTPRGVLISKNYKKIMIGCQKMAVKGLRAGKLPF